MKSTKLVISSCITFALLLSGCATVPSAYSTKSTTTIGGRRYVSVRSIAGAYNLEYHWDGIAKKAALSGAGKELRVMADSQIVLLNNSAYTMPQAARVYQNSLVIPQTFTRQKIDPFFRSAYIEKEAIYFKPKDLVIKRVVIDAGHGGKDPGAIGRGGLKEKDVTLDVARRLKKKLQSSGIEVVLTRDSDEFVSLRERAKISDSSGADFFISIHANAARSKWVSGIEVFYLAESIDDNLRSAKAAKNHKLDIFDKYSGQNTETILWHLVLRENRRSSIELAQFASNSLSKKLSQRNRGEKPARFYVLKTNLPAILIEVGFISNSREEKRLRDSSYKNNIAQAISEGLLQYNSTLRSMRTVRY